MPELPRLSTSGRRMVEALRAIESKAEGLAHSVEHGTAHANYFGEKLSAIERLVADLRREFEDPRHG